MFHLSRSSIVEACPSLSIKVERARMNVAVQKAVADPRIVGALVSVSKKTRAMLGLRLAEIGLMAGEDDVLLAIEVDKPVSISDLSTKLRLRVSTMHRCVDQMIEHGQLERVNGTLVQLSRKGISDIPRVTALRAQFAEDLAAILGAEAILELAKHLQTLDAGLDKFLTLTI